MSAAGPPAGSGARLDRALSRGRPGLICYLPLGDPALPPGLPELFIAAGVDVLEIGLPVDDPFLDGPTITGSMHRAREAGVGRDEVLARTRELRERAPNVAMVWMTYREATRDAEQLAAYAAEAGVDGILLPEPAGDLAGLRPRLEATGVPLLPFVPHEAGEEDVAAARAARGYVMVQAVPGKTGATDGALPDSAPLIRRLRDAGTRAAIALGIGIGTPGQARDAIAMGADAVVVGSAVVEAALRGPEAIRAHLRDLRGALGDGGA